jgi:hypothetical protein
MNRRSIARRCEAIFPTSSRKSLALRQRYGSGVAFRSSTCRHPVEVPAQRSDGLPESPLYSSDAVAAGNVGANHGGSGRIPSSLDATGAKRIEYLPTLLANADQLAVGILAALLSRIRRPSNISDRLLEVLPLASLILLMLSGLVLTTDTLKAGPMRLLMAKRRRPSSCGSRPTARAPAG